ncbi:hypothetical protein CAPTEDRAFT_224112 [Capitella teleta]|uniref:Peptidase M3A/M3B catalytic domain-containing protein n=1 Tax=Capitella teleta TaxID=283909 RepID=R7VEG5_CAPTE|nr:hypothetical protein CAPTEDRAFT_224112 [Capitella teleta]|eukprot:ELU16982.1 hypothetical protein CAPTEDRAFT_224112 [Capitella teleta]
MVRIKVAGSSIALTIQIDRDELREYFPLEKVLSNLWELCGTLFDITIKDFTSESAPWNPDVRFFKVLDSSDGSEIGSFFLDPYARPSDKMTGSWMDPGRDRSDHCATKPLSFLNLNLTPPSGQQPCLMAFEDVENLFFEFGNGLQQLLTKVPYSELSGQANIEWDSIFSCANFVKFLFHKPQVMRSMSCHYRTGHHLPPHVIETILASQNHMRGYDTMRQLYFSAYDMELNISDEHWSVMMENVWREYMPLPLSKEDNHPCSLTQLFTDDFAGAYYSHLWSKMIGADIMSAFEEVGFDDMQQLSSVGKRFRDTYLSLGGGVAAGEVFRRFRGRDPTQEALLKRYLPSDSQS